MWELSAVMQPHFFTGLYLFTIKYVIISSPMETQKSRNPGFGHRRLRIFINCPPMCPPTAPQVLEGTRRDLQGQVLGFERGRGGGGVSQTRIQVCPLKGMPILHWWAQGSPARVRDNTYREDMSQSMVAILSLEVLQRIWLGLTGKRKIQYNKSYEIRLPCV